MIFLTMLGLRHNENYLVDYSEEWPVLFEAERQQLVSSLEELPFQLEHYGSTSIPGLRAKPILDMLLGIPRLEDWELYRPHLEALGYDYAAHAGVPNHHVFGRGRSRDERTHLLHIVELMSPSWKQALAFRDALRSDPHLRGQYLLSKEQAAKQSPEGRSRYNELKHGFFVELDLET